MIYSENRREAERNKKLNLRRLSVRLKRNLSACYNNAEEEKSP